MKTSKGWIDLARGVVYQSGRSPWFYVGAMALLLLPSAAAWARGPIVSGQWGLTEVATAVRAYLGF